MCIYTPPTGSPYHSVTGPDNGIGLLEECLARERQRQRKTETERDKETEAERGGVEGGGGRQTDKYTQT